MSGKRRIMNRK